MKDYHSDTVIQYQYLIPNISTSCKFFYFCYEVGICMYYTYQLINEIEQALPNKPNVNM